MPTVKRLTPSAKMLKEIKRRDRKRTEFNYGITTADRYVRTVEQAVGLNSCYKHVSKRPVSYNDIVHKASRTLVYSNPDMEILEKSVSGSIRGLEGIELPKQTLMVFEHVLTTPRKDRDGDILRTQGASIDPSMLLLWQHIPTLPIGKMLAVSNHSPDQLVLFSAIVDLGELAHDAAVMIDNKMGRFSHGFSVREYEELKASNDDPFPGFDIKKFEILEESLVSIPSNVDAETLDIVLTLVEGGKLHSPLMKQYGKSLRAKTPLVLPSGLDLGDSDEKLPRNRSSQKRKVREKPNNLPSKEAEVDAESKAAEGPQTPEVKAIGPYAKKRFDVELEHVEASTLEYEWASRWLGCQIKEMEVVSTFVPSFRKGSFLSGLKVNMDGWEVRDTRNLTYNGKEEPPFFSVIQLNSKLSDTFLVDGMEFLKTPDGEHVCVRREETWGGIAIVTYVKRGASTGNNLIMESWDWARKNNFLKGEAFSLSGDFIPRKGTSFDDVFLTEENEKLVKRVAKTVNQMGSSMPSRGMLFLGSPGTGKTLTGRVLLNETKASFIWVAARDFYNMGAIGGICSAFDLAKELAPAIVFIEDIDNWMSDYAVDVIKTEMDGLDKNNGILTIMTTNYPERLPSALIDRPGRFHDIMLFDLPNEATRQVMLQKWAGDLEAEDMARFVKETDGYSGAHIYELVTFAKMILDEDENNTLAKSLDTALAKINEQRELIGSSQTVKPYGRRQWNKDLTFAQIPIIGQKAGRSLSQKNRDSISTVCDDLKEVEKDSGIGRGSKALLERSIEKLESMVGDEYEDDDDEKNIDPVINAAGVFLGQSTLEQKAKMLSILKAMEEISLQEDSIQKFRSFMSGSALRRS